MCLCVLSMEPNSLSCRSGPDGRGVRPPCSAAMPHPPNAPYRIFHTATPSSSYTLPVSVIITIITIITVHQQQAGHAQQRRPPNRGHTTAATTRGVPVTPPAPTAAAASPAPAALTPRASYSDGFFLSSGVSAALYVPVVPAAHAATSARRPTSRPWPQRPHDVPLTGPGHTPRLRVHAVPRVVEQY